MGLFMAKYKGKSKLVKNVKKLKMNEIVSAIQIQRWRMSELWNA